MRAVVVILLAIAFAALVGLTAYLTGSDKWTTVVVAFAAALAVAWQSYETRRAASAAEKALKGANESLRVSQVLAIEAERRRLDANAPGVLVHVNPPEWPPRLGRQWVASEPRQFTYDETFRLPKDGSRLVAMRADGFIRNEGDRTVHVSLRDFRVQEATSADGYPKTTWGEPGVHDLRLEPNEVRQFRYEYERPATDWIANSEAAAKNEKEPTMGMGEIVVTDGIDNGVIDWWFVEVSGRPFEAIKGEQGGWRLYRDVITGASPMAARVRSRVRRYYRSKENNQQLPELDLPTSSQTLPGGSPTG